MKWETNYFIFDLETGGLWAHNNPIIQLAYIVLDSNLKEIDEYSTYIKPYDNLKLEPKALEITGITEQLLQEEGKDVKEVWNAFLLALKNHKVGRKKVVLVGHNAATFDKMFLDHLNTKFGTKMSTYVESMIFDTMTMSRLEWGNIEVSNHTLGDACERAGITLTDGHDALNDVRANVGLFKYFANKLRGEGGTIQSVESAEKYERTFEF